MAKPKAMTRLCVKTRRGVTKCTPKHSVEAALKDSVWYVELSTDEASEYWFGCQVWIETAEMSPWVRVDLFEARQGALI